MNKRINILFHIAFWIANLSIIFLFFQWPFHEGANLFWVRLCLVFFTHMSYFYLLYFVSLPVLFKKSILGGVGLTALFTFYQFFMLAFIWNELSLEPGIFLRAHVNGSMGATFIFLSSAVAWKTLEHWVQLEQQKSLVLEQRNIAFLDAQESQMNPHTLFNLLNTVQGAIRGNNPNIKQHIHSLRKTFDYLNGLNQSKITLQEEIEFLHQFCTLHQLRFGCQLSFENCIPKEFDPEIPPLLFLPLVENAFKHGKTSANDLINIRLSKESNAVIFTAKNLKQRKVLEKPKGIGLNNLNKRLNAYFKKRFSLAVEEDNTVYKTTLKLEL